jgi:tetratricopeptide (TPR) repeat protein
MRLLGHTMRVFRRFEDGDARLLDDAIAARTIAANRLRQPQGLWWSHTIDATRALMHADWRRADELSQRARSLALRSMNTNQELFFRSQQPQVLLYRGDFGGMLHLARETCERFPRVRAAHTGFMTLRAAIGDVADATEYAREWRAKDLASDLEGINWMFEATCLAELALYTRDTVLAARLYEFLHPHTDKNAIVGQALSYNGPVAHYLALLAWVLGREDTATAHFEHALARERVDDAPAWIVRTQTAYATFLRRRGATEHAERLVREARTLIEGMEAPGLDAILATAEYA